jgi:hypothetical protein
VRYFSVWNESNLGQFLSPQYDSKGKPVAPTIYARMYRAAYAGIKTGNKRALVGIGETSARGRDRYLGRKGTQETESPGKFAELLSKQRPVLRFDAWSHHPYPTSIKGRPLANTRWPNVTLSNMHRFEDSLRRWFKRKITMWITEYGHETKPEEPKGVTYAQQASYLRTALRFAADDPKVSIFIWFILRDDPTSAWQSGLVKRDGAKKPAYAAFSSLAAQYDGRNPQFFVKGGTEHPTVRFAALELWSRSGTGAKVGMTIAIYDGAKVLKTAQPTSVIGYDGWVTFKAPFKTVKNHNYNITIAAVDANGNRVDREVLVRAI